MIKNEKLSFLFKTVFPVLLGILLMVYVVARAILLPITHDESNTCLTYSTMSIHDIVTYERPIPNNHILNTLLVKLSATLFGMHPFAARLPNILGFSLYFTMVFLFIRKITADAAVTFFGICVMVCNPYLLDFFSLARGYALSISFMMTALYFSLLFLEKKKNIHLAWSVLFSMLAVYTNFTTLNFYAAFIGLLGIASFQFNWLQHIAQKLPKKLAWQWFILFMGSLLLAVASYIPITKMIATNQFVYWGTNGFYKDTVLTLLYASQYNVEYFNLHAVEFSYLLIAIISIIILSAAWQFFKEKMVLYKCNQMFFLLVFIGSIIVNMLQFYLVDTPYLTSRTALFFYPLMAINFVFFAEWLRGKWSASIVFFSIPLSIFALIHLIRAANFTYCFEWWYDADTYKVINALEEEHQKTAKPIMLNCSWWFYPSLNFHLVTEHKDWIELAPFHQDFHPETDLKYNYYYSTSDDIKLLVAEYDTMLSLGWNSRFLMKKKEASKE
ncbi:MAG: hypothetical protein IPO83_13595 [Chitinophagaceae bacterium]|nr:hypothetical protein [Chitinophagaceae bacterium]